MCHAQRKPQAKDKAQTPAQSPAQMQSHSPTATTSFLVLTEENHTPLNDTTTPTISPATRGSGDMHALFRPVALSLPIRTRKALSGMEVPTKSEGRPATARVLACTEPYCVEADVRGLNSPVKFN